MTSHSSSFGRNDNSIISRWWWTVDLWILLATLFLIAFGILMSLTAGPAVARRLETSSEFLLAIRHIQLIPLVLFILLGTSLLPPVVLRRLSIIGFLVAIALLILVLFFGQTIKGSTRWIFLLGFSLQPSEFVKPLFAITASWLLSTQHREAGFPGRSLVSLLYGLTLFLLIMEPDFGQALLLTVIWASVMFFSGIPLIWFFVIALVVLSLVVFAYFSLAHVQKRLHDFFSPDKTADSYQIDKSLEAFKDGGLFGKGPGEGSIKNQIPDAHADFVFAVIGEEFGLIACLLLLVILAFIAIRGIRYMMQDPDMFIALSIAGLITQFISQSIINMATSLNMIPTKGMTMPFVSYGGSSLLASAFLIGALLSLTRRRR